MVYRATELYQDFTADSSYQKFKDQSKHILKIYSQNKKLKIHKTTHDLRQCYDDLKKEGSVFKY